VPNKRDPDSTHANKLLRLFTKLFFNDRSYSLTELATMLDCSKQTVQRLVDDIEHSMGVHIEQFAVDQRKHYRMPRQRNLPAVQMLSIDEMQALHMCHAFAATLLGRELFDEATKGLEKSTVLLPVERPPSDGHFASLQSGHIDYTPHQRTLRTLIEAMEQQRVCEVRYRRLLAPSARVHRIKPLKIFSYRDTVYLHTRRAKEPDQPWKEPAYHPLLAVHRIESVELTDQLFRLPKGYDFDRDVQAAFGVWQNEPFAVSVEFSGWAAEYVAERRWSADQRIEVKENGAVLLHLTARGRPEVVSWVMSFGANARVVAPGELVTEIREALETAVSRYPSSIRRTRRR
jgi:predicted DNA-binding transcriptional regulator YafY